MTQKAKFMLFHAMGRFCPTFLDHYQTREQLAAKLFLRHFVYIRCFISHGASSFKHADRKTNVGLEIPSLRHVDKKKSFDSYYIFTHCQVSRLVYKVFKLLDVQMCMYAVINQNSRALE